MTSERRVWAATGLLFLTFIVLAGVNPIVVDDMFITFQYVRNWVDHGVLTWWPGAPMVDGFTSLGHVMLLSLGQLTGMELIA